MVSIKFFPPSKCGGVGEWHSWGKFLGLIVSLSILWICSSFQLFIAATIGLWVISSGKAFGLVLLISKGVEFTPELWYCNWGTLIGKWQGGFTLAICRVPHQATVTALFSKTRCRKYGKILGQDKNREITVINYLHRENILDWIKLIWFVTYEIGVG